MRAVYSSSGANVTSNVQTMLSSNRKIYMYDCYWLSYWNYVGTQGALVNTYYTSASFPIFSTKLQNGPQSFVTQNATFIPKNIQRDAFEYEIGFKAKTLNVTWNIDDTEERVGGAGTQSLTWKQYLALGYMDDTNVYIYTAYMTDPQTLLGLGLKWRGYLRGPHEITRDYVKLGVAGLINLFTEVEVPTQTITPADRSTPYIPATSFNGVEVQGLLGSSSPYDFQFTAGPLVNILPDHYLRDWYFIGGNQGLIGNQYITVNTLDSIQWLRIRDNITVGGVLHILPYEPINPVVFLDDTLLYFNIFRPMPGIGAAGFLYVPTPENAP